MPISLHLPEDIDRAARAMAKQRRQSLHDLVVEAVAEHIRREMDAEVERIGRDAAVRYADALDRLGKS
ncbi:MAG: hypothetical protein ACRDT4_00185 [Micromonosporaceae bacterium]